MTLRDAIINFKKSDFKTLDLSGIDLSELTASNDAPAHLLDKKISELPNDISPEKLATYLYCLVYANQTAITHLTLQNTHLNKCVFNATEDFEETKSETPSLFIEDLLSIPYCNLKQLDVSHPGTSWTLTIHAGERQPRLYNLLDGLIDQVNNREDLITIGYTKKRPSEARLFFEKEGFYQREPTPETPGLN